MVCWPVERARLPDSPACTARTHAYTNQLLRTSTPPASPHSNAEFGEWESFAWEPVGVSVRVLRNRARLVLYFANKADTHSRGGIFPFRAQGAHAQAYHAPHSHINPSASPHSSAKFGRWASFAGGRLCRRCAPWSRRARGPLLAQTEQKAPVRLHLLLELQHSIKERLGSRRAARNL